MLLVKIAWQLGRSYLNSEISLLNKKVTNPHNLENVPSGWLIGE